VKEGKMFALFRLQGFFDFYFIFYFFAEEATHELIGIHSGDWK